jgi:MFS family permease
MPLYAVLVRENFPVQIIGSVVGAASMTSSLGMATGPLLGGVIFDTYGTYRGLYVSSFLVGLVAAAIMLTFRASQPPSEMPKDSGFRPIPAE